VRRRLARDKGRDDTNRTSRVLTFRGQIHECARRQCGRGELIPLKPRLRVRRYKARITRARDEPARVPLQSAPAVVPAESREHAVRSITIIIFQPPRAPSVVHSGPPADRSALLRCGRLRGPNPVGPNLNTNDFFEDSTTGVIVPNKVLGYAFCFIHDCPLYNTVLRLNSGLGELQAGRIDPVLRFNYSIISYQQY